MKKIYLSLFLAGATLLSFAQSKIDLIGQGLLKQQSFIEQLGNDALLNPVDGKNCSIQPFGTDAKRIVVLVDVEEGTSLADLEVDGAVVRSQIDNLALVEVDYEKVVDFSNLKAVKTLSIPRKANVKMDQARSKTGVNTVHRPLGQLSQPYKGAGVVTGLVDAGITVNHPNFKNSDGSSRVKEAWTITGQNGLTTAYDTDYKLSQFTTDLSTMSHGTHVAGIMSGSYKNLADTVNYYGVASESDIVMVGLGNDAYDNNILMGIEKVINYAEKNNQPCVVNLSLGSGYGPHDGTELFSQYLNKLAERSVICVAAGNEAADGIAITKTCTETDKNINTFVMPLATNGHTGSLEVWSNTNQTFKATLVLYDLTTKQIVYKLPTISESTNGKVQYVSSGQYAETGDITSPVFDAAFSNGYIGFGSTVDKYNNRFTVNMQYYLLLNTTTNPKGNIALGLMVEGNAGQRLDVYCTSSYSTLASNNIPGWTDGGGDGSITDASCAEGVISIGSFTTRDYVPVRIKNAGYNFKNDVKINDISDFSSYATLVDGRKLPHLTAPGCVVVSSMSSYYMTLAFQQGVYDYGEFMLVAKTMYEGKPYYYDYMMGTSMATPFASGVAALMLQANPDLTCKEVREILMETAERDTYVTTSSNPVQWGAGKINALDAVKKAIEKGAGVEDVKQDAQQAVAVNTIAQNQFEVTYIGATSVNATLFNLSGQPVVNSSAQGDVVVVDASNLASGVYLLIVESDNEKYTTKVVVK